MDDPNGNQFPWKNPLPSELFKREFLTKSPNGSLVKLDGNKLGNGVKGIFFGAKWVSPYKKLFRIIFHYFSAHQVDKCANNFAKFIQKSKRIGHNFKLFSAPTIVLRITFANILPQCHGLHFLMARKNNWQKPMTFKVEIYNQ